MDSGTDTGSELNGWARHRTLVGWDSTYIYTEACLIRLMSYSVDNWEGCDKDDNVNSSFRVRGPR
jgi:hypothetical protein